MIFDWIRHAFAVESSKAVTPSTSQMQSIDRICREIIRRKMTLPAQMFLESSAPAHFLAGQFIRFIEPFLTTLLDPIAVQDFATFLEHRGSVEYICGRLGELEKSMQAPSQTIHDIDPDH